MKKKVDFWTDHCSSPELATSQKELKKKKWGGQLQNPVKATSQNILLKKINKYKKIIIIIIIKKKKKKNMIILGCKLPLQSVKTALNPQHPKRKM